jgi:hypothetical protein
LDLNLVRLVFEVSADDPVSLRPHLYDSVRRFENYFKSVSCSKTDLSCNLCGADADRCPYRPVFGQTLSTDPDVLRRHQKPPLPFAFKISDIVDDSSCIELGLVLAGNAIQHISAFRCAIELMIISIAEKNRMDADVSGIWFLDYQGGRLELNVTPDALVLLSGLEILQASQHYDSIRICLESPLKLLRGGSIAHSFDFAALLRSQLRRCSSLFAYYGEGELELDYAIMSEASEAVSCLGNSFRFTRPQWTQRAGLAGISGSGEFSGLADGMLPLLNLGSYFNAGKGAAYGFGGYRIENV